MSTETIGIGATPPIDERRARFRQAVTNLSGKARSGDLLRMVLVPGSILVVGGVCLMILGWFGAARTHRQIEQIPYLISGGLLGLGFVILGGLLLATAIWMASLQRMRQQADERSAAHLAELVARIQEAQTPAALPARAPRPRNGNPRAKATTQ